MNLPFPYVAGTHGFLWTYASISSLGCIFIAICLPETRGKTPFEIADFYEAKSTKNSSKYTAASNFMRKINFPQFRRFSSSASSWRYRRRIVRLINTQYFFIQNLWMKFFFEDKTTKYFTLKCSTYIYFTSPLFFC